MSFGNDYSFFPSSVHRSMVDMMIVALSYNFPVVSLIIQLLHIGQLQEGIKNRTDHSLREEA